MRSILSMTKALPKNIEAHEPLVKCLLEIIRNDGDLDKLATGWMWLLSNSGTSSTTLYMLDFQIINEYLELINFLEINFSESNECNA